MIDDKFVFRPTCVEENILASKGVDYVSSRDTLIYSPTHCPEVLSLCENRSIDG